MTRLLSRLRCALTRHAFRRTHLARWEGWRAGGYTLWLRCERCGQPAQTRHRPWATFRAAYWDLPHFWWVKRGRPGLRSAA